MAHRGADPSNLPRIALQVSKDLKKKVDQYCLDTNRTNKQLVTELLEKLFAGKIKL